MQAPLSLCRTHVDFIQRLSWFHFVQESSKFKMPLGSFFVFFCYLLLIRCFAMLCQARFMLFVNNQGHRS